MIVASDRQGSVSEVDPYSLYLYAMKSPVTRTKYRKRLAKFLEYTDVVGTTTEEKARLFAKHGREDAYWVFGSILKFVQ